MKTYLVLECSALALVATFGTAQAQQADSFCPAAEGVRTLYGDVLSEEDISFLEFSACSVLEGLLSGELGLDGQPTDKVSVPAERTALEEDYQDPVLNLPEAHGEEPPITLVEAVVGPHESDSNSLPFWLAGGVVPVEPDPVSPEVIQAQKEYLAMGCAATPAPKACASSRYQMLLDADEAAAGTETWLEVK